MRKHIIFAIMHFFQKLWKEFSEFLTFFSGYNKKKILSYSYFFEKNKNILVRFFMMKRGRYNRPFLHISVMLVLGIGVLAAPFLAETFPIFSDGKQKLAIGSPQLQQSIIVGENVFQTDISQKPRDKVLMYAVQRGDTVSTIAKKFGISENTVRWANDLSDDSLSIGDQLKILPVTGIVHKVARGETIYSIAKLYNTNPQQIVDFPFNDFANSETFSLVVGESLIVPDGIKPSEQPYVKPQVYIVQGPIGSVSGSGFVWPVHGEVSQFASWYHMAIDITSPVGTPIAAAKSGTVIESTGGWSGGYGNHVIIDHGDGTSSLYAHMLSLNVKTGDHVSQGNLIGWIGLTGRTTGAHVHFEIRRNGAAVNPLPYLQ